MIPIGTCRFFDYDKRLENDQQESWELPRSELMVLSALIANAGQPVDKHTMRCGVSDSPQISESAVVRGVFTLRQFLGDDSHCLIETVKGVGYRLNCAVPVHDGGASLPPPAAQQNDRCLSRWAMPKNSVGVILMLCLLLGSYCWWHNRADQHLPEKIDIRLQNGQTLALYWLSPATAHNLTLTQLTQRLEVILGRCEHTPWQEIYAALSHDQRGLSLSLHGQKNDMTVIRNHHFSDPRATPDFLPEDWDKEEPLCD